MIPPEELDKIRKFIARNGQIVDQLYPTVEKKRDLMVSIDNSVDSLSGRGKPQDWTPASIVNILNLLQYYVSKDLVETVDAMSDGDEPCLI